MRMIKCLFAIISVGLIFSAMGQSSGPKFAATPDGFLGLTLNVTTIQDTEALLGPPDSDRIDNLDTSKLGKWLDPKHKEKIFRQLTYKKSPDFLAIQLSFLDEKLIMIDLTYKKRVAPEKLPGLFKAQFALLGGPAGLPDKPGQYPIVFIATRYPAAYSKVAVSEKTFIFVNCVSEGNGSSPGIVERTRQISRILERKGV
jgi:hypothetical protein